MTTPTPTGTVEIGPRGPEVRLVRTFHAPIEAVWAAVTESERLERWIGRWEGEPASGTVTFYMTAEGDDVEGETFTILECSPPHRFSADTSVGEQTWHLRVELSQERDTTTLQFAQLLGDDDMGNVGPGWEYYLDRLVASLADAPMGDVNWDDYFPTMRAYYSDLSG